MTTPPNMRLALLIGDRRYEGWKEVRVSAGIERLPSDFSIDLTERWPQQTTPWRINPGDECQVLIGDDVVVTGYVDAFAPFINAPTHGIRVTGRSKCADIVDCSADIASGQFKGASLLQVATALAKPYGIAVVAEIDTGGPLPDVQLQQGESIFALIERLSRLRQVLVCDDERGNLVLTQAGKGGAGRALVEGGTILRASGELNHAERFSRYVVKGQQAGSDSLYGEQASEVVAVLEDRAVTRHRTLVLVPEGNVDAALARARGEWELRRRAGRSIRAQVTVAGWRQDGAGYEGALWRRNLRVPVDSASLGVSKELVAGEVSYVLGAGGTTTELTLMPPEAFAPEPPDDEPTGGGKGGWADVVPIGGKP